jgi:hypothetical protein
MGSTSQRQRINRTLGREENEKLWDDNVAEKPAERAGYRPEAGPMTDFTLRSKMSSLGDNLEEKQDVFKNTYPDGELAIDTYSGKLTFRENPSMPMTFVDKPFIQGIKDLDVREFVTDVAELSSGTPQLLPEIGFALSPIGRGWGFLKNVAGYGALGAGIEVGKQGAQELYGSQKDTLQEAYIEKPLVEAGFSGGGAGVGNIVENVVSGIRGVKGGGLFKIEKEGKALQQASKELGIPEPLPSQVVTTGFGNNLLKRLTAQSKALSGTVGDYIKNMEGNLRESIEGLVDKNSIASVVNGMSKLSSDAEQSLMVQLNKMPKDANFAKSGNILQKAVVQWEKTSQANVKVLYDAAKVLAKDKNVTLDFTGVVNLADELKKGVVAVGKEGENINVSPLNKELDNIIKTIFSINPNTVTPDVAIAIRQKLFDLKTPNLGEIAKQPEIRAANLYSAITQSFDNPKAIGGEQFSIAWKKANEAAKKRFSSFEKVAIKGTIKSDQPEKIAANMVNGAYGPTAITQIKRIVGPKNWNKVQPHLERHILGDGTNILENLAKFDKFTLDSLVGRTNVQLFTRIGKQMKNLKNLKIKPVEADNLAVQPFMKELLGGINFRNVNGLQTLLKSSPKALDSFRSGLIDYVVKNSTKVVEGRTLFSYNALNSTLKQLELTDVLKVLKPEQLKALRNAELVTNHMKSIEDMGTSLAAQEAISGLKGASMAAIRTISENIGVGRLLTSKFGRRLLTGGARKEMSNQEYLKAMTFFLAENARSKEN